MHFSDSNNNLSVTKDSLSHLKVTLTFKRVKSLQLLVVSKVVLQNIVRQVKVKQLLSMLLVMQLVIQRKITTAILNLILKLQTIALQTNKFPGNLSTQNHHATEELYSKLRTWLHDRCNWVKDIRLPTNTVNSLELLISTQCNRRIKAYQWWLHKVKASHLVCFQRHIKHKPHNKRKLAKHHYHSSCLQNLHDSSQSMHSKIITVVQKTYKDSSRTLPHQRKSTKRRHHLLCSQISNRSLLSRQTSVQWE